MAPVSTPEFNVARIMGDGPATHGMTYQQVVPVLTRREVVIKRLRDFLAWATPVSRPVWYGSLAKRLWRKSTRLAGNIWPFDSDDYKLITFALITSIAVLWVASLAGFSAGLVIRFFHLGVGA